MFLSIDQEVNRSPHALYTMWFEVALTDAGAFRVTMGNAAVRLQSLSPNAPSLYEVYEISEHYTTALALLRDRLNSESEAASLGTIANILAHVCLCVSDLCAIHQSKPPPSFFNLLKHS